MKFLLSAICFCIAVSTHADVVLSINTNRTIQQVAEGQTMTLQSSTTEDNNAAAWQVNLKIVRESGSGTVSFTAPAQPTSNYFLDTHGQGTLQFTQTTAVYTNDRIKILDFDAAFPIQGSNVNGTRNLAELAFETSNNANGVFGIYLLNESGSLSAWTEISMSGVQENGFTAQPSQATSLRIGEITAVPEPSPFRLAFLAMLLAGANTWASRLPRK